ncbi:MAG: hypothetical protein JRJ39_01100 [Deltaproteobacteria bacterium]|nr:hypothetical protein [Deltaproteobacteria bacterium]
MDGGTLPLGLKQKFEKLIPNFTAGYGYGMTEAAPVTITVFIKKYMVDWPKEKVDEAVVKSELSVGGFELRGVVKRKITKWMLLKPVVIVDEILKTRVCKFNKLEIRKQLNNFKAPDRDMAGL